MSRPVSSPLRADQRLFFHTTYSLVRTPATIQMVATSRTVYVRCISANSLFCFLLFLGRIHQVPPGTGLGNRDRVQEVVFDFLVFYAASLLRLLLYFCVVFSGTQMSVKQLCNVAVQRNVSLSVRPSTSYLIIVKRISAHLRNN